MFDWKVDRKVIDNGPFEFRIETKKHPDQVLQKVLGNHWREFITNIKKKPTSTNPKEEQ
jgi:hypothetical protein